MRFLLSSLAAGLLLLQQRATALPIPDEGSSDNVCDDPCRSDFIRNITSSSAKAGVAVVLKVFNAVDWCYASNSSDVCAATIRDITEVSSNAAKKVSQDEIDNCNGDDCPSRIAENAANRTGIAALALAKDAFQPYIKQSDFLSSNRKELLAALDGTIASALQSLRNASIAGHDRAWCDDGSYETSWSPNNATETNCKRSLAKREGS
jgi:hypothetical protein